MEANIAVFWLMLFLLSAVVAACVFRLVTYLIDLNILTWALLCLGGITLLIGIALLGPEFFRSTWISSFVIIAGVCISGLGMGAILGTLRTMQRGGRRQSRS